MVDVPKTKPKQNEVINVIELETTKLQTIVFLFPSHLANDTFNDRPTCKKFLKNKTKIDLVLNERSTHTSLINNTTHRKLYTRGLAH